MLTCVKMYTPPQFYERKNKLNHVSQICLRWQHLELMVFLTEHLNFTEYPEMGEQIDCEGTINIIITKIEPQLMFMNNNYVLGTLINTLLTYINSFLSPTRIP